MRSDQKKPARLKTRLVPVGVHLKQRFEPWGLYVDRSLGGLEVDTQGIMLFPARDPRKPVLFPWGLCGPVEFDTVELEEPPKRKAARG